MALSFVTLDVFTKNAFEGNPLAIIHLPHSTSLTQQQKQTLAKEFNLSETVFLHEQTDEQKQNGDVRIDIFTIAAEIPFAGHPTVGTSNYLLHYLKSTSTKTLVVKAGRILVEKLEVNGANGASLEVAHNVHVHNSPFKGTSYGHHPVVSIVRGMTFVLAKVTDREELSRQTANLLGFSDTTSYQKLDEGWAEGLLKSYFYADLGMDESNTKRLYTRMWGAREDPATGSAASALCCWLSLSEKVRKRKYLIEQGTDMGRPSFIFLEITTTEDCKEIKTVKLSGSAVKIMEGQVQIPHVF